LQFRRSSIHQANDLMRQSESKTADSTDAIAMPGLVRKLVM
jgi:hypothetical protein